MALTKITSKVLSNTALTAPIGVANSSANVITLSADGRVGVGMEATDISTFGRKFLVNGTGGFNSNTGTVGIGFARGASNTYGYIGTGDWAVNGLANADFGISSGPTGALVLGTGAGTERMRINANGHVTASYQPSFLIRKTTGQTGSGGATINATFDTARDNVGSFYNTSTSVFTAPVAGRYLFTTMLNIYRQSATYFTVAFQINGAGIPNVSSLFYSQPSWTSVTQTIIVSLAVNDAVRVVVGHDNNATLDNSGYFGGMLLG